ncbi:hypothetical protein [Streptomyces sp. NPDC085665]|uniref:hypothetical protein n=1 Tax=Streptomyces sp. NPDC085665 TaxID=3365735 RepID=UPI0037CFA065
MSTATRPEQDALAAISGFLGHLEEDGYVYETRRLRGHLLAEYLEYTLAAEQKAVLTADELMELHRAGAWLAAAAAGQTRRRNTLVGPDAAAANNSQRSRIQTWNGFAAYLGLTLRLELPAPGHGDWLDPDQARKVIHTLFVQRPEASKPATAARTAAVAALVAATGRSVPELHLLEVAHIDMDHRPFPQIMVKGEAHPLDKQTAAILRRWLKIRAGITAQLDGTDPGYLWIPTTPGPTRNGLEPPKLGLSRAAVRTLHAAHRTLVLQIFGAPLRPGALRPTR